MDRKRLKNEQSFHNQRFAGDDWLRSNIKKYYSINNNVQKIYYHIVSKNCKNKKLLEYGCSTGNDLQIFENFGALITGIDISDEAIKKTKKKIDGKFYVMNAEQTEFKKNTFDIIVGKGIIHHLNLKKIYLETSRILNDNGHAVFIEPLGHNPLINLYRKLTPSIRTIDEHPLLRKDLKLLQKYFLNVKIQYHSFLTILAVPFRKSFLFKPLLKILYLIDQVILKIPLIREWAWIAIIHVHKPIK